jgi:hypothetical protein
MKMKYPVMIGVALCGLNPSGVALSADCLNLQDNKVQSVTGKGDARQSLGYFTVEIDKPLCNRECDVGDLIRLNGKYKKQLEWSVMKKSNYWGYVGKNIIVTGKFSCKDGTITENSIKVID